MTTTDTDALTERIARALAIEDGYDPEDPCNGWAMDSCRTEATAAVLPIVAEEVRKAKAEAWQEGVNFALPNAETTWYPQHNPYRATEHETGDQA